MLIGCGLVTKPTTTIKQHNIISKFRCVSHSRYFDRIWNSMDFCNSLVHNIFGRSSQSYAYVTTVKLSCRVQNFVVIGSAYFKTEHSKFGSNIEFGNTVIATGDGRYRLSGAANVSYHDANILVLGGTKYGNLLYRRQSWPHVNSPLVVSVCDNL